MSDTSTKTDINQDKSPDQPDPGKPYRLGLYGTFLYGDLEFTGRTGVSINKESNEKSIYVFLEKVGKPLGVGDLIRAFDDRFKDADLPDVLGKLPAVKSIFIKYGSTVDESKFEIGLKTQIEINDKTPPLDITLLYRYDKTKESSSNSFGGILEIGDHHFSVEFSSQKITGGAGNGISSSSFLLARYDYAESLNLKTLFEPLFKGAPNFIPDITIKNFKAFLLYSKKGNESRFLLGIGAGLGETFSLENLPMAGKILQGDKSFSLDEILVLVSWGSFEKLELKALNGGKEEAYKLPEPDGDILGKKGFAFHLSVKMTVGKERKAYFFSPGSKQLKADADAEKAAKAQQATGDKPETPAARDTNITSIPGTVSSSAKWVKINKKLGPVELQRIGFGYFKGNIIILLDSSITIAALGVQLKGFGLGFQPKWPPKVTEFYLDGLGISFKKDPIEVSGAFMRGTQEVDGVPVTVYTGAAVLKLSKFTISGLGSYAKVTVLKKDGTGATEEVTKEEYSSLFIYAVYDGPIGGPAFFFVNGIAAGFGINRKVNVPGIDEVQDFPLVSLAMNASVEKPKSLMDILSDLQTPQKSGKLPIEISRGDYWLAVGIKFTSFKIIDSFVLLIVSFGNRLRFDILGLSVLSLPPKLGEMDPLVYIELALKISFGTDSDVFSVEAMITRNSYVFGKDAKLRGGFALYIWVSGPNEGDFVVTLGGYHARFNKPAHYPTVDRLSLNWQILPVLSMKGELYFALTPSYIMAGGKWEVEFKTSFLRAYVIIWADILIRWAPFQYDLSAGIRIGIEAHIAFIHFKLEMSAELTIWGPPFAGEIKVDWVIFSFTIPFGDTSKKEPDPLSWDEFRNSFLPAKKEDRKQEEDTFEEEDTSKKKETQPLTIFIEDGIIVDHKDKDGNSLYKIVNPHKLALKIDSDIPITSLEDLNNERLELQDIPKELNTELGIRPMGVSKLTSAQEVEMNFEAPRKTSETQKSGAFPLMTQPFVKSFPEALWSPKPMNTKDKNPKQVKVIRNVLGGIIIKPVERPIPQGTPEFELNGKFLPIFRTLTWEETYLRTGPSNKGFTIKEEIKKDRNKSPDPMEVIKTFYLLEQEEHIPEILQDQKWEAFVDELQEDPVISGLGEIPQYKGKSGR